MSDLLDMIIEKNKEDSSPLAMRLRATSLSEVVGQEDILAEDKLLYKMIKTDSISSISVDGLKLFSSSSKLINYSSSLWHYKALP